MIKESPLKERPLRQAGQSGRELFWEYLYDEMFVIVVAPVFIGLIAAILWVGHFWGFPNPIFSTFLFVLSVIYSAYRIKYVVKKQASSRKQGIDGEVVVGEELEMLRTEGFFPFHDIPSSAKNGHGTNIDHVLVSKKGVFTIETKTLSKYRGDHLRYENGSFWLSGVNLDHTLIQSRAEAHWIEGELRKRLSKNFPVDAIALFPGQFVEPSATEEGKSQGVLVLSSKAVGSYLKNLPDELSDADVAEVIGELEKMNRE